MPQGNETHRNEYPRGMNVVVELLSQGNECPVFHIFAQFGLFRKKKSMFQMAGIVILLHKQAQKYVPGKSILQGNDCSTGMNDNECPMKIDRKECQ